MISFLVRIIDLVAVTQQGASQPRFGHVASLSEIPKASGTCREFDGVNGEVSLDGLANTRLAHQCIS